MSVFFKNVIVFWRTKTLFLEIKVVACFSFFFPPSLIFSLPLFLKKNYFITLCVWMFCLLVPHACSGPRGQKSASDPGAGVTL